MKRVASGRGGLMRVGWGIAIFLLAVALRAIEYSRVFTPKGVMPSDGADDYYHLRRIWYSVVNFPKVLEHDTYMAYPFGGDVMWPPGFDLAIAALARLMVGDGDQEAVAAVAVWVPPVLAGITAVAAGAIAARVFTPAAGVVAGLGLALLPGHYVYSSLGSVDHHCAAAAAGALLMLGAVCIAQRQPDRSWIGLAAAMGLGAAVFLYIWPGALLHLALLQGLASLWMLQSQGRELAIVRARQLGLAQAATAIALAPYALGRESLQFGSFSPLVLCNFQPLWFGANALACLLLARIWAALPPFGANALRRWAGALALAACGVLLVLVALPDLAASLDLAAGWFRGDEKFLAGILEMLPLFNFDDAANKAWWGRRAELLMTRFIFVFPVPLLWLVARALRTGRADLWLVAVWGGVTFSQALAQTRFINSFSVAYVVVLGGAGTTLIAALVQRLRDKSLSMELLASAAVLAALAFALAPAAAFLFDVAKVLEVGPHATARAMYREALMYRGVADWIAATTPKTSGYLDASQMPEYGILARWDRGHLLRYETERPVVQDNFAFYAGREAFDAADAYFAAENEAEALEILEELGVRYVVTDGYGSGQHRRKYNERSMARRLYPYPASENPGNWQDLPLRIAGFRQHRMILETRPRRLGTRFLRVFERVTGALISGRATPNSVVVAQLEVTSASREEPGNYQTSVRASEGGSYALRVPYSTGFALGIRTADGYRVSCSSGPAALNTFSVAVSEAAVASGDVVEGPTLDCE